MFGVAIKRNDNTQVTIGSFLLNVVVVVLMGMVDSHLPRFARPVCRCLVRLDDDNDDDNDDAMAFCFNSLNCFNSWSLCACVVSLPEISQSPTRFSSAQLDSTQFSSVQFSSAQFSPARLGSARVNPPRFRRDGRHRRRRTRTRANEPRGGDRVVYFKRRPRRCGRRKKRCLNVCQRSL